jgi:hypothetical protein
MTDVVITKLILGATALALIGWDIWVFVRPPSGDTLSEVIRRWATEHPVLPFAFGVLMGHLFWT